MSRELLRRLAVVCVVLCAMLGPVSSLRASAQSGSLSCDDFTNTDAAQIVFEFDDDEFADLDEDGDGEACNEDDDTGGGGDADISDVTIGADIDDVETALGDPTDDADANDFTIGTEYAGSGDIDTISIYWLNDTAARVAVTFGGPVVADDAIAIALGILPADVVIAEESEELEDGALLIAGASDDLADLYTDADYEDAGVDGAAGDLRVILIPDADGDIATIDVAIGDGSEYEPGSGGGGGGTDDPVDADVDEYFATVRDAQETMTADLVTFTDLLANAENWTDADIESFTAIVTTWAGIEAEALGLDAPEGLEDIQATYEDAAVALGEVSINITLFLTESDDTALDAAFEAITTASTALTDLDALLSTAGV